MSCLFFFFFNDTATTEIYTLSLHDALPICLRWPERRNDHEVELALVIGKRGNKIPREKALEYVCRSEEHTSELQSQSNLVCRLLLEKKKNIYLTKQQPDLCNSRAEYGARIT